MGCAHAPILWQQVNYEHSSQPIQHDRTKHVEVDRHLIKEKLNSGLICTPFVPTNEQLADVLTKGLSGPNFHKILSKMGMCYSHFPSLGGVLEFTRMDCSFLQWLILICFLFNLFPFTAILICLRYSCCFIYFLILLVDCILYNLSLL